MQSVLSCRLHPTLALHRRKHVTEKNSPHRPCVVVRCAAGAGSDPPTVVARWSLDAKFGCKTETISLLKEWVSTVASAAGTPAADARLATGQIGARESLLELELMFTSLSDLEAFFASLPGAEHVAWLRRLAPNVVDTTPRWEVLRSLDLSLQAGAAAPTGARASAAPERMSSGGLILPGAQDIEDAVRLAGRGGDAGAPSEQPRAAPAAASRPAPPPAAPATPAATPSSIPPGVDISGLDVPPGCVVVLDWKDEPMILKPGDNIPRGLF